MTGRRYSEFEARLRNSPSHAVCMHCVWMWAVTPQQKDPELQETSKKLAAAIQMGVYDDSVV